MNSCHRKYVTIRVICERDGTNAKTLEMQCKLDGFMAIPNVYCNHFLFLKLGKFAQLWQLFWQLNRVLRAGAMKAMQFYPHWL